MKAVKPMPGFLGMLLLLALLAGEAAMAAGDAANHGDRRHLGRPDMNIVKVRQDASAYADHGDAIASNQANVILGCTRSHCSNANDLTVGGRKLLDSTHGRHHEHPAVRIDTDQRARIRGDHNVAVQQSNAMANVKGGSGGAYQSNSADIHNRKLLSDHGPHHDQHPAVRIDTDQRARIRGDHNVVVQQSNAMANVKGGSGGAYQSNSADIHNRKLLSARIAY